MAFANWFIRVLLQGNARNTASTGTTVPASARRLEDGTVRRLEDGTIRVLE